MLIGIEAERANAPQKTGVEHYAQQLILQFAELTEKGLPFKDEKGNPLDLRFVLYLRTEPEEWIKKLPSNFSYKVMPFPIFWTQLRLSWEMLLHPPDVLFVPTSAIPIISPKKTVCTIHDSAFLFYPETFTPFMRKFLHYSYKYISRKAWKIITPSKASKDDLVKYYHTKPDKIQVVWHGYTPQSGELKNQKSKIKKTDPDFNLDSSLGIGEGEEQSLKHDLSAGAINGVKEETITNDQNTSTKFQTDHGSNLSLSPSPGIGEGEVGLNHYDDVNDNYNHTVITDATSEHGNAGHLESSTDLKLKPNTLKLPPRFVLFLSTLQPRKNLERLIDATKLFREQHPEEDIKLVVAGKVGWRAESILEKIGANKDFVQYLSHVTDEQRAELYQKAEAFCVPSFYEGFGMWILEAFDVGVPVITSNVSSMPEVGGEAVEYCDPHSVSSITQALENVLLNPQRKAQLVKLGIDRLKDFSWPKCAKETLSQILS